MKVCAYHGNLYRHHAAQDFADIKKKGFDTVLLCMTEQDMLHSLGAMRALRITAEDTGLDVWVGPWGLAGIFGGEGVTSVQYQDNPAKALRLFNQWAEAAAEAGFQTVFLDEPRPFSLLWHLVNMVRYYGMTPTTSLTTETFDSLPDEEIKAIEVASLGLSNYFPAEASYVDIADQIDSRVERLVRLCPDDHHVWIQGFSLGTRPLAPLRPWIIAKWTRKQGAKHLGFWSFRACEDTSSIAYANPEKVWEYTERWMKNV